MKTIGVCMIVKNEESVIANALESVSGFADEIIVADTGSTDRTVEIAKRFTEHIHFFPWQDDFSAARNFSFSKSSCEYLMWLDADDVVLCEDAKKISDWKESDSRPDVVMLPYNAAFDADGTPTFTYYRERILRRAMNFKWHGAVHEAITPAGHIEYLSAAVTHCRKDKNHSDRNLRIYEKLLSRGEIFTPRDRFYYARELYFNDCISKAVENFSSVRDDPSAWVENRIDSCRMLSKCYARLNKRHKSLESLLLSFSFAPPRAEACCDIGEHFINENDYNSAVFWYRLATTLPRNDTSGAFISPDCYDFIPYLQLCVCYDRLGDIPNARLCHQKASACKPLHPAVLHNQTYFSSL